MEDFDQAVRFDPESCPAHHNKAVALLLQKKAHDAIASFTTAIELDPKYANAYLGRSKAYEYQGDKIHAAEDAAKAKELGANLPATDAVENAEPIAEAVG
jgi:tetratricopeptide (TPR) repeat protein